MLTVIPSVTYLLFVYGVFFHKNATSAVLRFTHLLLPGLCGCVPAWGAVPTPGSKPGSSQFPSAAHVIGFTYFLSDVRMV